MLSSSRFTCDLLSMLGMTWFLGTLCDQMQLEAPHSASHKPELDLSGINRLVTHKTGLDTSLWHAGHILHLDCRIVLHRELESDLLTAAAH